MERPVNKAAYSNTGHIVDQARLTDVRYGCRTSDLNGCGWIAVYNFLRCMGARIPQGEIIAEMARHSLFRGLLGTSPLRVLRYLRKSGFPLRSAFGVKRAARIAETARSGILLYRHSGGWHFVAFERADGGRLHFYTAIAGAPDHMESMGSFLKRQNLAKVVWLMYRDAGQSA